MSSNTHTRALMKESQGHIEQQQPEIRHRAVRQTSSGLYLLLNISASCCFLCSRWAWLSLLFQFAHCLHTACWYFEPGSAPSSLLYGREAGPREDACASFMSCRFSFLQPRHSRLLPTDYLLWEHQGNGGGCNPFRAAIGSSSFSKKDLGLATQAEIGLPSSGPRLYRTPISSHILGLLESLRKRFSCRQLIDLFLIQRVVVW